MKKVNHWLIIYDITDPKRLSRVSKILSGYATRVQRSVFEAEAEISIIDTVRKRVNKIIDTEKDFIVYFNICSQDWQKKEKYGQHMFETLEEDNVLFL